MKELIEQLRGFQEMEKLKRTESIMDDLKPDINNLLFMYLPDDITINEAEAIALVINSLIWNPRAFLGRNKVKTGIELIAEERQRQIEKEGWTPEHDDEHKAGELANAAAYYAMTDGTIDFINSRWGEDNHLYIWPFELEWLKRTPENRIRELQKAGALIAAEIDRLNRIESD